MDENCKQCSGTGWVCESCGTMWELDCGATCCGAGVPCVCNESADVNWLAVYASTDGNTFDNRH